MRIIAFPDGTFRTAQGCLLIELADGLSAEQIEDAIENGDCMTLHTFTGEETALGERYTDEERALVEEGLAYTETNGAPALRMRPGTKRMERLCESIQAKSRPYSRHR